MRIAVAEADLNEAGDLKALVEESWSALMDVSLDAELRMRAGVSLLIAADLSLDATLSAAGWNQVAALEPSLGRTNTQALRARLIYHTVFGSSPVAVNTARRLLRTHPLPSIDVGSVVARRNALFALQILGELRAYWPTAVAAYEVMIERKIFTEAVYLAVTLAEDAIAAGDFGTALGWLSRAGGVVGRLHETAEGVTQGYMSALSSIAMHAGDYASAASLLAQVHKRLRLVSAPRLRAINSAYLSRLAVFQDKPLPSDGSLEVLRQDYDAGCKLGRQDTVVESLWLVYTRTNRSHDAARLLREYFAQHRRELSRADWSLWHSTRADSIWRECPTLRPKRLNSAPVPRDTLHSLVSMCVALS